MKCIWQIKFEQLLEKTITQNMWMVHQIENSEGRRKYDPFIKTIREELDELIASLPKEEHVNH